MLYQTFRRSKVGLSTGTGLFNLSVMVMVIGFFIRNFFDDLYVEDTLLLFWFLVGTAFSPACERDTLKIKVLSIGWFVKKDILKLLHLRENIEVIAFDPCEEVVREYRTIESPRLKVECQAVEAQSGTARLFIDSGNRGATSTQREAPGQTIQVPATTFETIIAQYGHFDFVYINCEGCEIPVILTTPIETLRECSIIFVQFHKFIGLVSDGDIEQCLEKLKEDFDCKVIEPRYPNYKFIRKGVKETVQFRFIE
jgi:FkbM family methyltransferase